MAPSTDMIDEAGIGPRTAATDGNLRRSPSRVCKHNNRPDPSASNARKTSAAIVVRVVECVEAAAGASFHALFRCCTSRAALPINTIH
jgi:hypothetical protein